MSYIIGYNAKNIKVRWYISNFEHPTQGMTRYKAKAFRFDTSERASAMVKHLKMIRNYDWKIEEVEDENRTSVSPFQNYYL